MRKLLHSPPVCRIKIIVNYLLDKLPPSSDVALLGVLPRGKGSHLQPSVFSGGINSLNEKLK